MKIIYTLLIGLVFFNLSCTTEDKNNAIESISETTMTKGEQIIFDAIQAHGGDAYDQANYAFTFRKKKYTFINEGSRYNYTVTNEKDGETTIDYLANDAFSRQINGVEITLSEEDVKRYTGALNSVIYFATLPHKLNDESVHKMYVGETDIKGHKYAIIEVKFSEEGGGEDHQDEYHYWINKKNNKIDYFAYNYIVNEGGVRFRTAYNKRVIDGVTFQDYVNYEAPLGTPLINLPKMYENGELKELSRIETEDVVNLSK